MYYNPETMEIEMITQSKHLLFILWGSEGLIRIRKMLWN